MPEPHVGMKGWAIAAALVLSAGPVCLDASDLSMYRNFKLGMALPDLLKQTGVDPSRVKIVHRRPALIQELEWRLGGLGTPVQTDTVKDLVFTFYGGELYQIVVNYDRYATEGMTVEDFTEAISARYGAAIKPGPPAAALVGGYGGSEEVVAQWQDAANRYELIRAAYGPTFRLIGTQKDLHALASVAIVEATRLDNHEAPQREAERLAREQEGAAARLDQARRANRPKFKP